MVNSENKKNFSNRFCLVSFMNSKILVNCSVWNYQYVEKFTQKFVQGCPQEFSHRFMYISSSSDHSLLTPNLPFKSDSEEVWGWVFFMSGVRTLLFSKDWWKFIQIHQYHTMALIFHPGGPKHTFWHTNIYKTSSVKKTSSHTDAPGKVTDIKANDLSHENVELTWVEPEDDGGYSSLTYVVDCSSNNGQTWSRCANTNTTDCVAQFLDNNKPYRFRVQAENIYGRGEGTEMTHTITKAGE